MRALHLGPLVAALVLAVPAVALTAGPEEHVSPRSSVASAVPAPASSSVPMQASPGSERPMAFAPRTEPKPVAVASLAPLPAIPLTLPADALASAPVVPGRDGDPTHHLLETACGPENTPERQAARDRLNRELVPRINAEGLDATPGDEALMVSGLGDFPCAAWPLRVSEARVLGGAARVSLAGGQGGCSVLMRRTSEGWRMVMVLGWTLRG